MQVPIVVVADEGGRFISAIESQRGPVSVVRHVHDIGEMLGVAQSGIARAVLIVTQGEDLTLSMVRSLHQLEVAVCLVTDDADQPTLAGVHPIASLSDTAEIISEIEKSLENLLNSEQTETHKTNQQGSPEQAPITSVEQQGTSENRQEEVTEPRREPGKIIAVWGPHGSPGRTTVALNLAAAYTENNYSVCLVDADTYGASIAAVLGITDDYSSLAQLCHHADRGNLSEQHLKELTHTIAHRFHYFDIITGINRPDRWAEIRASALEPVIGRLASQYDIVLLDIASCIEEDPVVSFDGLTPQRNDAAITSLRLADSIIAVGLADVVGVPRLIKAY